MSDAIEDKSEDSRSTGSTLRIITWWRKFHFSGRVIMCSVLLGLGLILIGGLIFAINMDDDSGKTKADGNPIDVPTKAPSNYSGPVVMGIGGFIVTVGVIMCLFETQVCRKKTGDSKPLICENPDDTEKKVSDPTSVPSTSHGHKIHRHGARKASSSPRKHKSRHGKSHSKERNPQKSPSPKSLPISVEPPKNYITSSGENFLTPPNTLDVKSIVKNEDSREADDKNSSLMKSFTSSGPSWNQSAEFLTPSTSFRDASLSLNNSIEIERHHDEINPETELTEKQCLNSEYLTPLTVEEHRIQQLLIRVKNEQMITSDTKKSTNAEIVDILESDTNVSTSVIKDEIIQKVSETDTKFEIENKPTEKLHSTTHSESLISGDTNKQETLEIEDIHKLDKCEKNISEASVEGISNEPVNNALEEIFTVADVKIFPAQENPPQKGSERDLTADVKEHKNLEPSSDTEISKAEGEKNDEQVDFESSVSSNETVISRDGLLANNAKKSTTLENESSSILKANSSNESSNLKTLESAPKEETVTNNDGVDHLNSQENVLSPDSVEAGNLKLSTSEPLEALSDDIETTARGIENVTKDVPS